MTCNLVHFASRSHVAIAGRTAHGLLRHTFDLLPYPFEFLFGTLATNCGHPVSSAVASNKNCSAGATDGNAAPSRSRLTGQET
jgi:hypothetical protein